VQGFSNPQGGLAIPTSVQLRQPQRGAVNFPPPLGVNPDVPVRFPKMEVPPQGFEDKGYASVLWSAHDDNDDDLIFSIYYHGEGEQNWRLLKDKLTQKYYSWDATTMPDGAYYLKIVASDSPSNPADQSLTSERESDRFEIENAPPTIENLHAAAASATTARVTFEAASGSSAIARWKAATAPSRFPEKASARASERAASESSGASRAASRASPKASATWPFCR